MPVAEVAAQAVGTVLAVGSPHGIAFPARRLDAVKKEAYDQVRLKAESW